MRALSESDKRCTSCKLPSCGGLSCLCRCTFSLWLFTFSTIWTLSITCMLPKGTSGVDPAVCLGQVPIFLEIS